MKTSIKFYSDWQAVSLGKLNDWKQLTISVNENDEKILLEHIFKLSGYKKDELPSSGCYLLAVCSSL